MNKAVVELGGNAGVQSPRAFEVVLGSTGKCCRPGSLSNDLGEGGLYDAKNY